MTTADCLCSTLCARLRTGRFEAPVHSAFDHAMNFAAPFGLLTLLTDQKPLQPYSIRLLGALPRRDRSPLSFSAAGVFAADGTQLVSLQSAAAVDLALVPLRPLPPVAARALGREVAAFLAEDLEDESLAALVTGGKENHFTAFLAPRIANFRRVMRTEGDAAGAAAGCAGCGMGLTPSSDDLLGGYLAALYAIGGLSPARLRAVTEAAADKTNDISGAVLRRTGEGLVSQPVLRLLTALGGGGAPVQLLREVAELGSTSGRDTLTGICMSLFDMGGEAV